MPARATDHFITVLSAHSDVSNPEVHSTVGIITAQAIAPAAMTVGMAYTSQSRGDFPSLTDRA
jgi:hypothetical protein